MNESRKQQIVVLKMSSAESQYRMAVRDRGLLINDDGVREYPLRKIVRLEQPL